MDALGDRMKKYEAAASHKLVPRTPVIIRCDGRSFHSYTRGFEKPFSSKLIEAMVKTASIAAKEMMGFRAAYIQSDEMSFLITDYEKLTSQGWFDYKVNKINSVTASLVSVNFNDIMRRLGFTDKLAYFDCRCFNVPRDDVANCFYWRKKDWERNSLSMYCQKYFSHKMLMNKNREAKHEMLYGMGKNWATDCSDVEKNGTFLVKGESGDILSFTNVGTSFDDVNNIIKDLI